MRRLLAFLGIVAALVGLAALATWWVDPDGRFYSRSALAAADAASPPCLVSDELVGTQGWLSFKLDVVRRRQPETVVLGTSRVLEIGARPGERAFANAGMPGFGTPSLVPMLRRLHAEAPGLKTVYIGADLFWFNHSWLDDVSFGSGPYGTVGYLLGKQNVRDSLRDLARSAGSYGRRFTTGTIGDRCLLDRRGAVLAGRRNAWEVDGSFRYERELLPASARPVPDDYTRDLVQFAGPYYTDWASIDARRLRELRAALRLARSYGWNVVGFTAPYSSRYVQRLATAPQTAQRWREFGAILPTVFEQAGYTYLDLRDVRDVPCGEVDFVDDGWHPSRACAARVRDRLDAAARAQR